MWIVWLIVAIIFSIAELIYSGFFLLWFAIGAFCSMILSLIFPNSSILLQGSIFLVVSVSLLLTLTKKFTKKYSNKETIPTNIDKLIGKTGVVIQGIGEDTYETGLVKLDGEVWSAVSSNGSPVLKGSTVKVEEIKGVKLIVTPLEN